jgi:hypothetical protein
MSGPCILDELDHIVSDLADEMNIDADDAAQRLDLIERAAVATGLEPGIVAEAVERVLGHHRSQPPGASSAL